MSIDIDPSGDPPHEIDEDFRRCDRRARVICSIAFFAGLVIVMFLVIDTIVG